jgi:hypothetical protein
MVYALHKFKQYLLGTHFKMFTNHSALKYQVNEPILGVEYVDDCCYSKSLILKQL